MIINVYCIRIVYEPAPLTLSVPWCGNTILPLKRSGHSCKFNKSNFGYIKYGDTEIIVELLTQLTANKPT